MVASLGSGSYPSTQWSRVWAAPPWALPPLAGPAPPCGPLPPVGWPAEPRGPVPPLPPVPGRTAPCPPVPTADVPPVGGTELPPAVPLPWPAVTELLPPAPAGESDALHPSRPSAVKHVNAATALNVGTPMGRFFETSNIQTSEGTKTGAENKSQNWPSKRGGNAHRSSRVRGL